MLVSLEAFAASHLWMTRAKKGFIDFAKKVMGILGSQQHVQRDSLGSFEAASLDFHDHQGHIILPQGSAGVRPGSR